MNDFCFEAVNSLIIMPPEDTSKATAEYLCNAVLHLYFFKVACIPTVNGVPIPCNYANDTLMRCNCEFIKQQG